ncbi:uncharacterized protein LOC143286635 [Babylonia areolata]|uniref:uncharacterized protein LOC143286635 n=1 Tax=Babylonia areolata TaxID=304850 RepID=UPI003FD50AA2
MVTKVQAAGSDRGPHQPRSQRLMMVMTSMMMWGVLIRAVLLQLLLWKGGSTQHRGTLCEIGEGTCDFSSGIENCTWRMIGDWSFDGSYASVPNDSDRAVLQTRKSCSATGEDHCLEMNYLLSPVSDSPQPNELHVYQVEKNTNASTIWSVDSNGDAVWRSVSIPIRKGNDFKIWIEGRRMTVPSSSVIGIDNLQYRRRPCNSSSTSTPITAFISTTPTTTTTTTTNTTPTTTTTGSAFHDEEGDGFDNILYVVIGLVVAAVVTVANGVILCYCRKRRNVQISTIDNDSRTGEPRGPPALATAGPPDTDHYHTIDEVRMYTSTTSSPTIPNRTLPTLPPRSHCTSPTFLSSTTTTSITSRPPLPPPFRAGFPEPVASASSEPHEEDGYSTVDDNSTPSTSAAAPTFSKSRSVVVQRVKAKPVPASTRLLADSQTFSLLKQRCEPTTGEEDYNTLSLHHGQTPQETATKTGRELLYNHLDSVANSEVRAGHKSETTEQENYNSLSFHQGPNLKQTATTTTGRPAVYNHLDSVANSEAHTMPGPETTNPTPALFRESEPDEVSSSPPTSDGKAENYNCLEFTGKPPGADHVGESVDGEGGGGEVYNSLHGGTSEYSEIQRDWKPEVVIDATYSHTA